ncbi:tyrosinase family protein [Variovorax sp. J22P240]|uniref:tyrosinase family protein n=1 Tax=Variovorax sp. J22P240 TaxID=3053514 RepID=UPI0025785A68|nr:tyrosinase family protein [Variovorax sp. J22P240]MDM0002785.1 tyrosinase family protein [Variovorax sp. J22P240]
MQVDITINNSSGRQARYLTWAASPLRLRLADVPTLGPPLTVTLASERDPAGGDLLFSAASPTAPKPTPTLKVALPRNGSSVTVRVYGRFGRPSVADGDVRVVARFKGNVIGKLPVMVRVRKNATRLSAAERDRFVAALAQLNDRGTGRFADFRNMHVLASTNEAHGAAGFLPWHRAYLLDLERELQAIDPSVALPYWRFDRPAASLFTREFLGETDALGNAEFHPANPLTFWTTDGVLGVIRRAQPGFDPATMAARGVFSEADTLALGTNFAAFTAMEGNPHGTAHVSSFSGPITSVPTAARDPLFFLLHCNVDRLWARWQRKNKRFDPATPASYASGATPTSLRVGHNLNDTMWPWNGVITPPRPVNAPGGALSGSPTVSRPGPQPRVRDMLDYQGSVAPASVLGFAYDDVS